jgi:NAD(P)H dehydrogenase (quinone)
MSSPGNAAPMTDEPPVQVLVVYYSRFGAIKELATLVADGVRQAPGAQATLLAVEDQPVEEVRLTPDQTALAETRGQMLARRDKLLDRLAAADALVLGAPAYFGSMASPLKRFFEDCATASSAILDRTRPWQHYLFQDKPGAAFTSSGTPHGGNEQALHSMLTLLMHLGMLVVTPGQRRPILEQPAAPYGATAITGASGYQGLTAEERAEALALGQRVAEVATWVRAGQQQAAARAQQQRQAASQHYDPSA